MIQALEGECPSWRYIEPVAKAILAELIRNGRAVVEKRDSYERHKSLDQLVVVQIHCPS